MREAHIPCRTEPDLSKCRTSPVVAPWLRQKPLVSHCLTEKEDCRYALSFAYGYLCKHPEHLSFAEGEHTTRREPTAS